MDRAVCTANGCWGAKPPLELQGQSKLADRLTHLFINKIRDFLGGFALFNSPSDTRFALFKNFQILGFQVAIFRDGTDVFSNALLLSSKALDIFTGFFQFPVRIDLLPACLGKLCKLFRHPLSLADDDQPSRTSGSASASV